MKTLKERIEKATEKLQHAWDDDVTNDNAFYDTKEIAPLISELAECAAALEYYSVGWVQKFARINPEHGLPEEVWKNKAVQDDHGKRAIEALSNLTKVIGE